MGAREPLWTPSQQRIQRANLTSYMRWLGEQRDLDLADYDALWRWSVDELDAFWASIWDYFDVRASQPYERVLGSREMPGAQWFPGARLNYAENVFAGKADGDLALVFADERGRRREWSWGTLRQEAARIAGGLRNLGVGPGDRVAAYMPNAPETAAAFLACASIGAVWSSCSPDFGARGVLDRFAQIEPKVLLAVDGYAYQGREHDRREAVASLMDDMSSLQHTVLLRYLNEEAGVKGAIDWEQLRAAPAGLAFAQLPFDHPLWVLYSSGTTGLPKAIVQGQGGILMEHVKKLNLQVDLQAGDRLLWFTTTGWMMWNFLMGALLTPATIVLYDGNPAFPDMNALWDLAAEVGVTCFGTSASYIAGCMKEGVRPAEGRDLCALRSVGSTGSTLAPEGFDWIYEHLEDDTWLFSTSGGTDVCTAFIGGCPLLPVRRGELQCRALGANVQAFDEDGHPVIEELGELVITEPMPSMPLYFWNDPDGERYRESYFSLYPGIWRHGDWLELFADGAAVLHGRSDATINRGGIRMGSSEIYRSVLALPQIEDALVVDVDGWMPLFVKLRDGASLDDQLQSEIKRRVREECSPRHVPNEIFAVPAIPRTRTGKVLEVPVKRILLGVDPERAVSRESLADPDALAPFITLAAGRAAAA
ncbi:MAG: acetoacetate--CoA ligase [Solirubrobacteraceae bacterium]